MYVYSIVSILVETYSIKGEVSLNAYDRDARVFRNNTEKNNLPIFQVVRLKNYCKEKKVFTIIKPFFCFIVLPFVVSCWGER